MPREPLPIGGLGTIRVDSLGPHRWQAVAYTRDTDGVRRRIKATAPTKAKARTALLARHTTRTPPSRGELSLDTPLRVAAQKWMEQMDGVKHATQRNYEKSVRVHIVPLIGSLRLREVTASQLERFITAVTTPRTVDGATVGGPTAARHAKIALAQILDMCVRDDVLTHNPITAVKTRKRPRNPVTALTVEDVHQIRQQVQAWGQVKAPGPPRNAALLLDFLDVLAGTGCRPGEVLALRWEDVDMKAGTMRVTGTVIQTEQGVIRQESPKTATSQRWFALPAFTLQVLRLRFMRATEKEGPVFATRNGTWIQLSNLHRVWRQARGEEWAHVSFAHYRKAVATLISQAEGADAAAGQLGHSSPEVTRRYYIARGGLVDFSGVVEAFGKVAPK